MHDLKIISLIVIATVTLVAITLFGDPLLDMKDIHAIDVFFRKPHRKLLSRRKLLYDLSRAASLNPKVPQDEKCFQQIKQPKFLSKSYPLKNDSRQVRKVILVMSFGFEVDSLGQWIDDSISHIYTSKSI